MQSFCKTHHFLQQELPVRLSFLVRVLGRLGFHTHASFIENSDYLCPPRFQLLHLLLGRLRCNGLHGLRVLLHAATSAVRSISPALVHPPHRHHQHFWQATPKTRNTRSTHR